MQQLSRWAKGHKSFVRLIVTLIHVLLAIFASYVGIGLNRYHITFSNAAFIPVALLLIVSIVLYQLYKPGLEKSSRGYYSRKSFLTGVTVAGYLFICLMCNSGRSILHFNTYSSLQGSFVIAKDSLQTNRGIAQKRLSKTDIKQRLKDLRHSFKKKRDAGTVIGIFFVIVGSLLLLYLLFALACSISCAGSELLAILVAATGLVGITFLTVWVIKQILKKEKTVPIQSGT